MTAWKNGATVYTGQRTLCELGRETPELLRRRFSGKLKRFADKADVFRPV